MGSPIGLKSIEYLVSFRSSIGVGIWEVQQVLTLLKVQLVLTDGKV